MDYSTDFFSSIEQRLWSSKMQRDIVEIQDVIEMLQHAPIPEEVFQWRHYYMAYSLVILCQLMFNPKENAEKAIEVLRLAHGVQEQSSEFYVMVASSYGHLAASTRDPIKKAKAGIVSENSYKHAYESDNQNPRVYLSQGLSYLHKPRLVGGSKRKALKLFTKSLALFNVQNPTPHQYPSWGRFDAIYWLAHCYLYFNQFDKAKAEIETALNFHPDLGWANEMIQKIERKRAS